MKICAVIHGPFITLLTVLFWTSSWSWPRGAQGAETHPIFQPGDHIAIIGNTMADRMQHAGWLESYLHALHPRHELTFRNLGFAADQVALRQRSANFGDSDQWLKKCKADVVFCFFGYNEAILGPSALPKFEADLVTMIRGMRSQNYNGDCPPRLVIFSPIAHENLRSRHLPDGKQNNEKLALYTGAMRRVCDEQQVVFVDLFAPTRALYAARTQPLTINGIHLSADGNKLVAEVILRQ